jgi:putative flavoprotein involved in K+ transport
VRSPPLIIGGGPAGLAVAGALRQRGIHSTVLDANAQTGDSWRQRYDRLHLHTPRRQSGLPGFPIPRVLGRWVARDDMVTYLGLYAQHHRIEPEYHTVAARIDRHPDGYAVETNRGTRTASQVVVATGYLRVPVMPDWPGASSFEGQLVHASTYQSGVRYRGQRVLVVGTGNTGAEIATDLVEQGAAKVWLSYRTPPHLFPRQIGPIATTVLGFPNQYLPARLIDPVNRAIARLTVGDLSRYGLPSPPRGLKAQDAINHVIPILDVGVIEQIKQGTVEPVPELRALTPRGAVLADGRSLPADVVVAATGYRRGLEPLVGHLGVLDSSGAPTAHAARTHAAAPGLYFVGLLPTFTGLLFQINRDARAVSRRIARQSRAL